MIRVGISGWIYAPWRGRFYPPGLPHRRELEYASRAVSTIEINGSFYSLQSAASYRRWAAAVPEDFLFAVKGGRFITHMKKLVDVETPLANFFASGLLALGPKLGPILWQLPPQLPFDAARLERFLALLPRDMRAAAQLARHHDRRLKSGAALVDAEAEGPIRHALEVRHESYAVPAFVRLLRRAGVALVVSDSPAWPCFADVTADFLYLRLHGAEELYASGYDAAALDRWAARIRAWAQGGAPSDLRRIAGAPRQRARRDVFVYFDNDAKVMAPRDASALAAQLQVETKHEQRVSIAAPRRPRRRLRTASRTGRFS